MTEWGKAARTVKRTSTSTLPKDMEEMTDEEARDKDDVGETVGEIRAKPSRNPFPYPNASRKWHKQGRIEVIDQV